MLQESWTAREGQLLKMYYLGGRLAGDNSCLFHQLVILGSPDSEEEGKQQRPYRDTLREHLGQVRHGILFQCLLSLHALLEDQHAACAPGDWIWIRKTAKAKTPLDSQTSGDFLGKRWEAAKFSSWKSHGKRENLHAKGAGPSVCASCIPLPRSGIHLLRYSRWVLGSWM